ncbi:MAG: hypothetical protein A2293_06780 [Elusimicrobia bacterium RIFOXYB2_FULL_49_7]|nr:MAG: hypothetical protein A2293_06780 [Elusimicrobia bacterium RIFOXYB2_FULL_49_7]
MKRLQDILDEKNYSRLVTMFGGKRIWIPKKGNIGHRDKSYFAKRNKSLIQAAKKGVALETLSNQHRLSIKRIYEIINSEY